MRKSIKHYIKIAFVAIVIFGLIASYTWRTPAINAPVQNTQTIDSASQPDFNGPTSDPFVVGPSGAPAQNGPTSNP
jgi:hypothetical protein